jgi:hypothetical protein
MAVIACKWLEKKTSKQPSSRVAPRGPLLKEPGRAHTIPDSAVPEGLVSPYVTNPVLMHWAFFIRPSGRPPDDCKTIMRRF